MQRQILSHTKNKRLQSTFAGCVEKLVLLFLLCQPRKPTFFTLFTCQESLQILFSFICHIVANYLVGLAMNCYV